MLSVKREQRLNASTILEVTAFVTDTGEIQTCAIINRAKEPATPISLLDLKTMVKLYESWEPKILSELKGKLEMTLKRFEKFQNLQQQAEEQA